MSKSHWSAWRPASPLKNFVGHFATVVTTAFCFLLIGLRFVRFRRRPSVGPEGRFLYWMLVWIVVLVLVDRGVSSFATGLRRSNRADRNRGLLLLIGGITVGSILAYFQKPAELFAWFREAWSW